MGGVVGGQKRPVLSYGETQLLRRGQGYRDRNYLLLKAQRLAATKTQFMALQTAA